MSSIHSINHSTFPWSKSQGVQVRGYAFLNGELLQAESLGKQFHSIQTPAELGRLLRELNGCFAVMGEKEQFHFAAVDRVASFPLFFNSDWKVFDQLKFDRSEGKRDSLGKEIAEAFSLAGYSFNRSLLISDHFQLQAGEFLWFAKSKKVITQYQDFLQDNRKYFVVQSKSITALSALSEKVVDRLIQFADGKCILLGLSGGLDSRFLLAALVKQGYKNIKAFTYGAPNSFEVPLAKNVAEKLSVDWHFVEYTNELLEAYFSPEYKRYSEMAHPYRSLPYEQDWFALKQLCEQGIVDPTQTVFVSGFAADICSGSWIPKTNEFNNISSVEEWRKYMARQPKFFGSLGANAHSQFIQASNSSRGAWDAEGVIYQIQRWGLRHRLSRYQLNGMRAPEFFGMEWYLPFVDDEYLDFWSSVQMGQRIEKKLYRAFLNQEYFKAYGIGEEHQSFATYRPHDSLITKAKMRAPKWLKKIVKPLYLKPGVADPNNLNHIRRRILEMTAIKNEEEHNLNQIEAIHLLRSK